MKREKRQPRRAIKSVEFQNWKKLLIDSQIGAGKLTIQCVSDKDMYPAFKDSVNPRILSVISEIDELGNKEYYLYGEEVVDDEFDYGDGKTSNDGAIGVCGPIHRGERERRVSNK